MSDIQLTFNFRRDPFTYLEWVFGKLPGMTNQEDFAPLLPASWVADQEATEKAVKEKAIPTPEPTIGLAA